MPIKIRSPKDLYAGLLFLFFGVLAMGMARNYPMGSAVRMGPGYFPSILGGCLTVLGMAITARSLWLVGGKIKPPVMRPLLLVLGAVFAFSFLIEAQGLLMALLALIAVSSLASWEFQFREVIFLYLLLAALSVGVFFYFLGLPFKVWPI